MLCFSGSSNEGTALLPGQRYGESCWIMDDWAVPETHPNSHPGLCATISYEERRLAAYYFAEDPSGAGPSLTSKSSFLLKQTAMVKVIVGQWPESTWILHEALLTAASRFMAAALFWPFKEKEERTIRLPDMDKDMFEYFVQYLYKGQFNCLSSDEAVQLYVLADRLQAPTFRDEVFEKLITPSMITLSQLDYVMDNTIPGDRLRKQCLAWFSYRHASFYTGESRTELSLAEELFRKHNSEILASGPGVHPGLALRFNGSDFDTEEPSTSQDHPVRLLLGGIL
ncbi:hypothetical protein EDD37DRAFT_605714 [Exophiala viscosa]|uniref:uncharacterized protein n=1 Tax=Exophiala viscosa TaxID=2486360 RepID=UPI00219959D1|nr:hypothetical protein EDD37DRAFT_605714 [Exophiala viscosa]